MRHTSTVAYLITHLLSLVADMILSCIGHIILIMQLFALPLLFDIHELGIFLLPKTNLSNAPSSRHIHIYCSLISIKCFIWLWPLLHLIIQLFELLLLFDIHGFGILTKNQLVQCTIITWFIFTVLSFQSSASFDFDLCYIWSYSCLNCCSCLIFMGLEFLLKTNLSDAPSSLDSHLLFLRIFQEVNVHCSIIAWYLLFVLIRCYIWPLLETKDSFHLLFFHCMPLFDFILEMTLFTDNKTLSNIH